MNIKSRIILKAAGFVAAGINKWKKNAIRDQEAIMKTLIKKGQNTVFGNDHHFDQIDSYEAFKKNIPVRDYEELRPYIDMKKMSFGPENQNILQKHQEQQAV